MRGSTCSVRSWPTFMKRAKRGFSRIGAFGEEMPNIENRIELAERQG